MKRMLTVDELLNGVKKIAYLVGFYKNGSAQEKTIEAADIPELLEICARENIKVKYVDSGAVRVCF